MSYDLLVFDPEAAPDGFEAFMGWYDKETEWPDDIDHTDLSICTAGLRTWLADIQKGFPSLQDFTEEMERTYNGPRAISYSMSPSTIYAAFSWSCAEDAYQATLRLAEKHRLGFFDLTDLGTVWMPDEAGKLHVVYRGEDYPDFWQFE